MGFWSRNCVSVSDDTYSSSCRFRGIIGITALGTHSDRGCRGIYVDGSRDSIVYMSKKGSVVEADQGYADYE